MTWTPTAGLKQAEEIINQIADEISAGGHNLPTLYYWRMVQVIGGALDKAMGAQPQPGLTETLTTLVQPASIPFEVVTVPNDKSTALPEGTSYLTPVSVTGGNADTVAATVPPATPSASAKRGRGRPKGSTKKKTKAVKAPHVNSVAAPVAPTA